MKKLFISQPMRGKTNQEIETERVKAIETTKEMLQEPVCVLDSFFKNAPSSATPLWYLSKAIELLSSADVACFTPGWEDARGCCIEHQCAESYGIKIIEL